MEIRVLRYFIAVAQEETISGAALLLHLSQPTLSRQLRELEEELGVTLFVRGNRKISLTEEGLYLLKRASEILSLVDRTAANLSNTTVISGDIAIGGGESEGMRTIAKTIKILNEQFPDIRTHLYSGNADDLIEKLDQGILDFAIVIDPVDKQKYDIFSLPEKDSWGLLMLETSSLSAKEVIRAEDLLELPLIISRQSEVANELTDWLGTNLENQQIVATYNLLYNAALLVSEGVGYALCLDKLIQINPNTNLIFRPLFPKLEAKISIIWKKNQIHSNAAKKFLELLQER